MADGIATLKGSHFVDLNDSPEIFFFAGVDKAVDGVFNSKDCNISVRGHLAYFIFFFWIISTRLKPPNTFIYSCKYRPFSDMNNSIC